MKRRVLVLGDLFHFAVKLRGGRLVKPGLFGKAQDADSLQDPQDPQRVHVPGVFRRVKGYLHMGLSRQVVDLIRLDNIEDTHDGGLV